MRAFRHSAVAVLAALGVAACTGSTGPQGPVGPTGPAGTGTGNVSGALTATGGSGGIPGITVSTVPNVQVTATTSSTGTYTLSNLPIGVYSIVFSGTGISTTTVTGVSVVGGETATVNASAPYSPIAITLNTNTAAGFGGTATVTANVTGATGPLTYSWSLTKPGGLSPAATVPVLSPSGTTASFTTNLFTDYNFVPVPISVTGTTSATGPVQLAGTSLIIPNRAALLGISPSIEAEGLNYTVTLKVSDGTYTQTNSISVYPIGTSPGTPYNAANVTLIANDVVGASYNWSLSYSATDPTVAAGTNESSLIKNPTAKNPVFTTNAVGFWALTNSATSTTLHFRTANYIGLGSLPSSYTTCGACHPPGSAPGGVSPPTGETDTLSPDVAWGKWSQSAHANYYWDPTNYWYTTETLTGPPPAAIPLETITINGAAGFPTVGTIQVPTVPGALTLFSQGVDGILGNHYGLSCVMCHTDGYKNPEALPNLNNGGFSDVAATDGWTFPNNSTLDYNRYNAVPANLQNLAGIQCESCHGPISMHPSQPAATKPLAVWNTTACAVCHDEAPTHAAVSLWSQSKHANYQVAINEGGVGGSCVRCHTAQGFAAYVDAGLGTFLPPANTATSTPEGAMPQTCQACHDPHTTGLRVNPSQSYTTPAGFIVENVGKGSTCMVCHNSRNFQRGDNVQPCAVGISSGSSSGASPFCTPVTSIGLPSGTVTVLNIATPHDGREADVFLGQNAYFVTTGIPSKHTTVADTCVGCHVLMHPTSLNSQITGANTNHTFIADGTICANCHSAETSLAQVEGQFKLAQQNLFNAMPAYFSLVLGSSPNYFIKLTSGFNCTSAAPCIVNLTQIPTAISIVPQGGSFTFTLGTPVTVGSSTGVTTISSISLANISLTQATATTLGPQVFMPNGVLARVLWNDTLVSSISTDPSAIAIHNPTFVFDVLASSLSALQAPPVTNNGQCVVGNCQIPY
ncbi:MAG TPA: carboxypeptidase regulatory-like domain-containing protein [Anaeromyxobacteraceae bacterium]|nr:carboxypeptidase regulatory-like domain-containing protein [Anaeromyxobacteraceae bacterium]